MRAHTSNDLAARKTSAMPSKPILLLLACYFLGGCVFKDTECERGSTDPRCDAYRDAAVDSGASDGGMDAARDAAVDSQTPCADAEVRNDAGACVECTATTDCAGDEVCKLATFECVQCLDDDQCGDDVCNTATNRCVECVADTDCMDPLKPTCGAGNACVAGCDARTDCERFAGAPACNESGECRQCDPSTETNAMAGDCGAKSCDPATWTCTTTDRGALNFCQTCVADSECKTTGEGTYRCVNITWTVDADRSGNYCVLDKATTSGGVAGGACPRTAKLQLGDTMSSSGVLSTYCGPRSTVTTCEAVRAVAAGTECSASCPVGTACVSGDCRLLCTDGFDCSSGQMCNDADADYCG